MKETQSSWASTAGSGATPQHKNVLHQAVKQNELTRTYRHIQPSVCMRDCRREREEERERKREREREREKEKERERHREREIDGERET